MVLLKNLSFIKVLKEIEVDLGNLLFSFFFCVCVLPQLKQGENIYAANTLNTLIIVLNSNTFFIFHQIASAAYMAFFIL